jgi:signal transduction histidine kinase
VEGDTMHPVNEVLAQTFRDGWRGELSNKKKDGSTFPIWLSTSVVRDEHGTILGLIGITTDITERKRSEQALRESRDQLRKLAARLEQTREEERKYIAHEMREEFAQVLSAIKLHMSDFSTKYTHDEEFIAGVTELSGFIDLAIESVRKISSQLRPGVLDLLGLTAAIEWHAREISRLFNIRCDVDVPKGKIYFPEQSPIILFRMLQDALKNVVDHAQATHVQIQLRVDGAYGELRIEDNGKGMSEEQLKSTSSIGLVLLKERALSLGGSAEFKTTVGKGTTIVIRVPLSQEMH